MEYDRIKLKDFIDIYFLHNFSHETIDKIINCLDEFFEDEKNNLKDALIAQLQNEAIERSKFSTAILNAQLGSSYLPEDFLEKAVDVLRKGGEVYWMDKKTKHVHSVKNPHPFKPFGCNGECCEQPKEERDETK